MKIADFVAKTRISLNMSLREFGKVIGVSHNAVWLWEKGRMRPKKIHLEIIKELSSNE